MRQVTRKGLATVMATGGVFAAAAGVAHADSSAGGSAAGSPGVASGNNVQVPVHIPVNVCGNTVDVIGLLNPAFGNRCANVSKSSGAGAGARAGAKGSPGVLSGNNVQVPVDIPVNACGNSIDVVGAVNPAMGNECGNVSQSSTAPSTLPAPVHHRPAQPHQPAQPHRPTSSAPSQSSDRTLPQRSEVEQGHHHYPTLLAQTGGTAALGVMLPAGAVLVIAGIAIYRRSTRPGSHRS